MPTNRTPAIDWRRVQLDGLGVGRAAALSTLPETARSEYLETQFFEEFAKHTCLRNFLGAVFLRDEHWVGNMGFFRHRLEAPFLPEHCDFVAGLNAHAYRTLLQSEYITLLEDAVGAFGGTMDAIYLIDQHGNVRYANGAASRLAHDGRLTVEDRRLATSDKAGLLRVKKAIAACLANRPRKNGV